MFMESRIQLLPCNIYTFLTLLYLFSSHAGLLKIYDYIRYKWTPEFWMEAPSIILHSVCLVCAHGHMLSTKLYMFGLF